MNFVINKCSFVYIAVRHFHLALQTHVIFPQTSKNRTIFPSHLAFSLSFSSHKFTLIFSLFKFSSHATRQAKNVFQSALAVWSSVFEISTVFVSVFKIDDSKTKKINISPLTCKAFH